MVASHPSYNETAESPIVRILERLENVKRTSKGFVAMCPAHDDRVQSLSITEGDTQPVVVYCFAGCEPEVVLSSIGLTLADLCQPKPNDGPRLVTGTATQYYDYEDVAGHLVFQVERRHPKRFLQRQPDGNNGWTYNLDRVVQPLYHQPELDAEPERWVLFPEGEKDVDRLRTIGFLSTTIAGGANAKLQDHHIDKLHSHPVAILSDNDAPGLACAHERAARMHAAGIKVKVVTFGELPHKGDVSDWLDQGNAKDHLIARMKRTPLWSPDTEKEPEPESVKAAPQSHAVVLSLSTIQPKAVEWLWDGWIARGKFHLLGGHPGDGKSTVTIALASTLSIGGRLPDGTTATKSNVLLVLAEDDLEDTVRPRIDLHNGDPSRIWAIKLIKDEKGNDRALNLAAHIAEIRTVIETFNIDVVIIDPITSYLPKADRNAEGDVRDALTPFTSLIEETGIAAIGIMHVGKASGQGRKPLQMLLGSTAFGAMARIVWMTAELPEDEQPQPSEDGTRETRKLLGVIKSNISMLPAPIEWSRPLDGPIRWQGKSTFRMEDVLSGVGENPIETAKKFLLQFLAGGSKPVNEIFEAAKDESIAEKTLRRAKDDLKVEKFKETGVSAGRWFWKLPNSPKSDEKVATFHNVPNPQDGHLAKVTTFPNPSNDGQVSSNGHLPSYPKGSIEDGQLGHLGNVATLHLEPDEEVF